MNIDTLHNKSQLTLIVFLAILILVAAPEIGLSKNFAPDLITSDLIDWKETDTQHTIICYQSSEDLEKFNTLINLNGSTKNFDHLKTVSNKIDILFKRSQQLLGMHGFVNKIKIKIFKNKHQLDAAYYGIYKKESNARAWYTHEKLTVFVQLNDLHEGMLAHEIAHSIIDHYMIVPPPGETAEILARYVDTHLIQQAGKPGNEEIKSSDTQAQAYSTK
jgi:hypothetical protein